MNPRGVSVTYCDTAVGWLPVTYLCHTWGVRDILVTWVHFKIYSDLHVVYMIMVRKVFYAYGLMLEVFFLYHWVKSVEKTLGCPDMVSRYGEARKSTVVLTVSETSRIIGCIPTCTHSKWREETSWVQVINTSSNIYNRREQISFTWFEIYILCMYDFFSQQTVFVHLKILISYLTLP